jgi:hypothetical protein
VLVIKAYLNALWNTFGKKGLMSTNGTIGSLQTGLYTNYVTGGF